MMFELGFARDNENVVIGPKDYATMTKSLVYEISPNSQVSRSSILNYLGSTDPIAIYGWFSDDAGNERTFL